MRPVYDKYGNCTWMQEIDANSAISYGGCTSVPPKNPVSLAEELEAQRLEKESQESGEEAPIKEESEEGEPEEEPIDEFPVEGGGEDYEEGT